MGNGTADYSAPWRGRSRALTRPNQYTQPPPSRGCEPASPSQAAWFIGSAAAAEGWCVGQALTTINMNTFSGLEPRWDSKQRPEPGRHRRGEPPQRPDLSWATQNPANGLLANLGSCRPDTTSKPSKTSNLRPRATRPSVAMYSHCSVMFCTSDL